jgi:hypothetical protein
MVTRPMAKRYTTQRYRPTLLRRDEAQILGRGEILRSQTQKAIETKQKQAVASQYDDFFQSAQFATISQAKEQYDKVPAEIKQYMSFNISNLEAAQKQNIQKVQSKIQQAREDSREAENRAYKAEYRAREKGYREALKRLGRGELLSFSAIRKYANELGNQAYDRKKESEARKKQAAVLLKTGAPVTKINYEKGTATIGGQTVKLNRQQLDSLTLSSVAKAKLSQNKILRMAQAGTASITFTDTSTGRTTTQIVEINKDAKDAAKEILTKRYSQTSPTSLKSQLESLYKAGGLQPRIEDIKTGKLIQEGRFQISKATQNKINDIEREIRLQTKRALEQRADFEKMLGPLIDVYSKKEVDEIFRQTLLRGKPTALQQALFEIDKDKTLNPIQKEYKKRELLGITPGNPIKQGLFPKLTDQEIKNLFNKIGISPQSKNKDWTKLEDYLRDEYFKIANKPVEQRTTKDMALVSLLGIGSAATATFRKVPGVVWNVIVSLFSPIQVIKGFYKLATDSKTQSELSRKGEQLGARAQRGDPTAISDIASEIIGSVGAGKIISKSYQLGSPLVKKGYIKLLPRDADIPIQQKSLSKYFPDKKFIQSLEKIKILPITEQRRELIIIALKDRGIKLKTEEWARLKSGDLEKALENLAKGEVKTKKGDLKSTLVTISQKAKKRIFSERKKARKAFLNDAFESKFGLKLSSEILKNLSEKQIYRILAAKKKTALKDFINKFNLIKKINVLVRKKPIAIPSQKKQLLNAAFENKFGLKLNSEALNLLTEKQLTRLLGTKKKANLIEKLKALKLNFKKTKQEVIKVPSPKKQLLNAAFENKFGLKITPETLNLLTEKQLNKLLKVDKVSLLKTRLLEIGYYIYKKKVVQIKKLRDLFKRKTRIKIPKRLIKEGLRKELRRYGVKLSPKETQKSSIISLKKKLRDAIKTKENIEVDLAVKELDEIIANELKKREIYIKIPESKIKKLKAIKVPKKEVKKIIIPLSEQKRATVSLLRKLGVKISDAKAKETKLSILNKKLKAVEKLKQKELAEQALSKLLKGQILTKLKKLGISIPPSIARKSSKEQLLNRLIKEQRLIESIAIQTDKIQETVKFIDLNKGIPKNIGNSFRKNKKAQLRFKPQLKQKQKELFSEYDDLKQEIKVITIKPGSRIISRYKFKIGQIQDNMQQLLQKIKNLQLNQNLILGSKSKSLEKLINLIPPTLILLAAIRIAQKGNLIYLPVNTQDKEILKILVPEILKKTDIISSQQFKQFTQSIPDQKPITVSAQDVIVLSAPKYKFELKNIGKLKQIRLREEERAKRIKLPEILLPSFRSPKIQDKIAVFEAIFRERRNINKPYNKRTNPRIKKVIKYTTTRNKVLNKVSNRVLRSLSRSFEIRLVKTTNKKEKDSPRPDQLKYFTERTGKNPQVLQYVQKKGTSFKTIQEQLQLKALRRKSPTKPKKKNKNTRKPKKVSKKSSKK